MLSLLLILCFKIHTNYKRNTMLRLADVEQQDKCQSITKQLHSLEGPWYMINNPAQDYLIKCYGGGIVESITFSGSGAYRIRTSVLNSFKNGLFDIQNSNFNCTATNIHSCGSLSNETQLIRLRGSGDHAIIGTTFLFCGINPFHYIEDNRRLPDNWDPSLIYISGNSNNSFSEVKFRHEKTGSLQPFEIRPTRPIRLDEDCSLNLTKCNFYNSSCFTDGSLLHLGSTKDIFISLCTFEECYSEGGKGHGIYITNTNKCEVSIDKCEFIDCGKNNKGHVIRCEAPALILSNNNFTFTNTNCSGCVRCFGKGKYHFENNHFENAKMNSIPDGDAQYMAVGIHYDGNTISQDAENLTFNGNYFINIAGSNYGRCLSADIKEGKFIFLSKNTIENCPLGGFCVKIMQRKAIETFELNGWVFRNNYNSDSYGGGAGIWIENEAVNNNAYTHNYTLIIKNCNFENNTCGKKGGAFQMGYANDANKDKFVTRVEIQISGCNFINNTAYEEGGAIAIQTNYPLTITDCHFINNKSPLNGGAIFIGTVVPDQSGNNQQMPNATITDCEFIGNSGHNSHCIYILDAPKTEIEITYCDFFNNYDENYHGGACILSNAIKLTVLGCNFTNDDLEHSSGGVNVTSRSTLIISRTDFKHCNAGSIASSYGGGIGYCTLNSNDVSRDEYIEITDCTIDGNDGANGVAIGLKPFTYPVISDVTIKNHVLTNWIFFIFFQSETEGDFILNRIKFENNSYDSGTKSEFGGGTGIWIAESEDIDYMSAFNLVFERCDFLYNRSPENGGAISYGGSPRLQSVEMTFGNCTFKHNRCEHYYGGACRFETNKPVSIIDCTFDNNTAAMNSVTGGSGGGAIFIGETVQSILIDNCNFSDCFAYRGSFIFTNGALKNISISRNFFSTLQENQINSVYIEVDSQVTEFYFDSNQFVELKCKGEDGGAGLHIKTGAVIEVTNCKFDSCVGSGENSGMIRIPDESNYGAQLVFNLCQFSCEKSQENNARAVCIAGNSLIRFNSCRFLSFEESNRDGVVLYSESISSTVFYNCTFLGLKGIHLMTMPNAEAAEILDCQFSSCEVGEFLITAESATNFTVTNCIFRNDNDAIHFGSNVNNGLISYNSFDDCTSNSIGGVVYIDGSNLKCDIVANNFTKCQNTNNCLAIYINAGSIVNIHDCKFNNNHNQGTVLPTIYSKSSDLNFYDSIIEYSDDENEYQGGGIEISTFSHLVITNIQFLRLHKPSAIYVHDNQNNHSITVTECLFSDFKMTGTLSGRQCSCFYFGDHLNVEFVNNTIQNHNRPDSYENLLIGYMPNKIENCTFQYNNVNGQVGGGSGVEFSGLNVQIYNCRYKYNHIYTNQNKGISTMGVGGAIQIGYNSKEITVEIDQCTFENNYADYEGGALAIQCKEADIHDSTFINNAAAQEAFDSENANFKMGGAIYFNSGTTAGTYRLYNCVFRQNSADSNGHALFIAGKSTEVYINGLCLFEDNTAGIGSQIFVNDGATLDFSNSTVHLKNVTSKSRGIEVSSGNLVAHHTTFSKVEASSQANMVEGNAILVNDGDNSANIYNNTFLDCYIDKYQSYAVTFNGSELNFENNVFDFKEKTGCGCLRIYCFGNVKVLSNTFKNVVTQKPFSGAFYYEETVRRTTKNDVGVTIRFNTFEHCSSANIACFSFKWISQDYQFFDNIFQNNNLDDYLGVFDFMGKKIYGEFILGGNRFINNTAKCRHGGGTGLWFQNKPSANEYLLENHYKLAIEDCEFIGNHAVYDKSESITNYENGHGGALQLGFSQSVSNIDVVIKNTTFSKNIADREGGALSLQVIGYVLIDNCTFNENKAAKNSAGTQYDMGGAVFIQPDFNFDQGHYSKQNSGDWIYSENISILNTIFTNNQAADATAVYISSAKKTIFSVTGSKFEDNVNAQHKNFTIVSNAVEFYFMQSSIKFSSRSQAVAGIRTTSLITISASNFTNNCISDSETAESIFAEEASEEIDVFNSRFQDCGKDLYGYATIKLHAQTAFIERNIFNFTSNQDACHAIIIKKYSDVNFVENQVYRTKCSGAFRYDPDTSYMSSLEKIRIERCIFDDCQGRNSRAIFCNLFTQNFTFFNNTIQNFSPFGSQEDSTGYLFVFEFPTTTTEFVVDSIIFRNLTTDSDFGGGCGLWIKSRQMKRYTLHFKSCIFEDCHAVSNGKVTRECSNGRGGALQFGWTPSISDVDMVISNCEFIRNVADLDGGALCIMIQNNVEITQCKFTDNKAGASTPDQDQNFGGAIAIYPNYEYGNHRYSEFIHIDGCTFSGNIGNNANAIFIQDASNSDIYIGGNCKFIDNVNGSTSQSVAMIEARKLEMDECVFDFSSVSKSCNAINTNATTFLLTNSKFTRCCRPSDQGSALYIKEGTKTSTIRNSQFIDNGNNKLGSVIYTEAANFEYQGNVLDFTNIGVSDRGIFAKYQCRFYLTDSSFHHCRIALGGTGASLHYKGERKTSYTEDIYFDNLTFNNNSCSYASCFYMNPVSIPVLRNINVLNHKQEGNFVTVIIFQSNTREDVILEKWTFDNNLYNRASEEGLKQDCGGIGLWIAPAKTSPGFRDSYKFIFDTCIFRNNTNNLCGGAFAYGYSNTLRYIYVCMNDCTFENNLCDGEKGGALAFNGQVPVTIERSVFRGNKVSSGSYKGHCIYIDRRCKAVISDCSFVDNGVLGQTLIDQKKSSGQSIIQCTGAQLDFIRSNITFTDPTIINSRCIDIDYYSIVNLINSTFSNVNVGSIWGGALHLYKSNTSIIDEQITIDSCVFDYNKAGNGCSALLWATGVPTLINLSFRNQTNNNYVFCIFYEAFRDTSTVEDTVFENSISAGEDGGGSSIWIANNEDISKGRPFELTFKNCTWRNNEATKRGGAIHYGTSRTLEGVQLIFDKCHFIGNHAKDEGGAVSLVTKSPIVFSDCQFRDNYVESQKSTRASIDTTGTRGGSISINSRTPLVQISGCSFTNETSDEGNAIFIHSNVQACLISGSIFKNCGKTGTAIISETLEFMLLNSEISFDRRLQSCRALEITTISVSTISQTIFRNCHSTSIGAGIYLNNTLESEEQEDFTLERCTFDACESDVDGCALFLNVSSAPVLRDNTFQNHRFDKNISVILNYYDFQDLFSIQSCKFINNLFQNSLYQDGGGCAMFIANAKLSQFESTYKLSFEDCTWSKNSASFGGAFSYGNNALVRDIELVFERGTFSDNIASGQRGGALYLSTTQQIILDECTFTNNRCHNSETQAAKQGGAIFIASCSSISITGSTFAGNYATNGHAIFVDDIPSANVFGCTFDSNNANREGSQIATNCAEFTLYDCTIKFNEKKVQARGIEIMKRCSSSFVNCNFLNCNISDYGGGIHIVEDTATNRTETLTLDNCLFDKCDSSNGCAIQGAISCNPTIRKCTISNSNKGHFILSIFFNSVPTVPRFVIIDDCTFEGNYFTGGADGSSDAGGIGLWIAYHKFLSAETLSLSFEDCKFISNSCAKNGGAFAYGYSTTLKNISLTFNGCTFKENTCNGGSGGALYIMTEKPLTITDCHFINNKCNGANTKGGSIYVDSPSDIVQIRDSTFEGGQSIGGAGIYSTSRTINLVISDSTFTNCGSSSTGSVIYSEASVFSLQSSDIAFDASSTSKCRGVELNRKASATFSKVTFTNCISSGTGGGILINFQQGNSEENLIFKDITIENADATNGCAMHVRTNISPTLEEIKIRNCTSGHYVLTMFFNQYVPEAKLYKCSFENNQFVNNAYPPSPDGGGSGIWIANDGKRDDNKDKLLTFEECLWYGNSVKDTSSLKYGGGFALGTSQTTKQTKLEFKACRFIENYAPERGGALYLCTSLPVTISRCLFDGNEASDGASIYTESTSNVTIEYTQIVRSKASTNGAAYIKSNDHLQMLNVTFSENSGPTATSLHLDNEGIANIDNCNFDFSRGSNQYQIRLNGESSSASITFRMGCFIHSGDDNGNTHIYSTHKGTVNLPAGNCFDTSQNIAINNQGGSISTGSGIFDCHKCGSIYIPTIAPDSTPSASHAPTEDVTSVPTEVIPTSTTSSSSQSSGSSSSNTKKKNAKTIAMIAGITAAIVVVIVVIIILIWLFVCRKKSAAGDKDSDNASEMNDEQITEISGIDPGAEDPIWAGTNQDNPLFNGGDDQDEDQMIHNDFEESWGDSVI